MTPPVNVSVRDADKSKPYFPVAGIARDGYNRDGVATATCFCGAVQLEFPTEKPGLVDSFICHCTDCHKITASMFASNFVVKDSHLKHNRGESNLTSWSNSTTIGTPNTMTNFFCKTCGSLLYRRGTGFPGTSIMRIGTVDDFNLMEGKLRPRVEQFIKDRLDWVGESKAEEKCEGYYYG